MVALFISHSSRDNEAADWIRKRLAAAGYAALFLDFDPEAGMPAGRNWERELYRQLRKADAIIFLGSSASAESRWCFAEVSLGRSLGRPVFPLSLEAGVRLPLLGDVQWIDLTGREQADLTPLWGGLRRAGLDPADSFSWDPTRPPYPGLEPFEMKDAAVFFGREQEVALLTSLLQPTLRRGAGQLVGVVGPSGSGKSSLVRAGLIPRLQRAEGRWIILPPMLPGRRPVRNLAHSMTRAFAAHGAGHSTDDIEDRLRRGSAELVELTVELAERAGTGPSVLLVVDQAEELLTRIGPREQEHFLQLLDGARSEDSPLWIVATVRSEFLSTAPERAGLAAVITETVLVEPLSKGRLPEVIARPAQRAGLDFAPGLIERLAGEAERGDGVPLLAYTLRELYQRAGPDGVVTDADYAALGGVVGALQQRADQLADELGRRQRASLVLPTLIKLAAVEREGEPTRRRVPRTSFSPEEAEVIDAFVDARLLTTTTVDGETVVEVAHEALLRQWNPLREAIDAERSSIQLRSEAERLALDWIHADRDTSYLLRGGRLSVFDDWARAHPADLGPPEREFMAASREAASRELEAARRSNRRLRGLAAGLAIVLVVALGAGAVAYQRNQTAQAQTRLALSRQLDARAEQLVDTQPDIAILLGLESLSFARDAKPAPTPDTGLVTGLARLTHPATLMKGHTDQAHDLAFSPNGKMLASVGWDKTLRLWDASSGAQLGRPVRHPDQVDAVAFSPDGRLVATACRDKAVRLWNATTGQQRSRVLLGHTGAVEDVAFSPDGHLVASASRDKTVRLWNAATGRPLGTLTGHKGTVAGVAFSPDGTVIATASWDKTVRLWSTTSGRPLGMLTGHKDIVTGVAFSPDGRTLASSSLDGTVRFWNVASRQALGDPLSVTASGVRGLAFSPDGKTLATADADKTVRLWDVDNRQPRDQPLLGHTNDVGAVAFSPDGQHLASASWDGSLRLWSMADTYSVSRPLLDNADIILDVAYSPDGRTLASASGDGMVRLWKVPGFAPRVSLSAGSAEVNRVAFSHDGRVFVTASSDGSARLWRTEDARPYGHPVSQPSEIYGVALSRDGKLMATGSTDTTVRLYSVPDGTPTGPPLQGHQEVVNAVAFSPDNHLLASASSDQSIVLWSPADHRKVKTLLGHTNAVNAVAFSPDGRLLASGGEDHTVRLWNVRTGGQIRQLDAQAAVKAVAFNTSGTLLATGGADKTVRVWNPETGRQVREFTGHTGQIWSVAFSPNQQTLASGSDDKTVRTWDLTFDSWLSYGCKLVNRNLSISEWNELIPGFPYHRTCPNLPSGTGAPPDAPAATY